MMNKETIAAWLSIVSNFLLTLLKIIVGFLFNSQVLIADGIHNAGDFIASVSAFVAMRISKKPADDDHPYGHGKAEVIAAVLVAGIMAVAALWIGYKSVETLFEPAPEAHLIALIAAVISYIWKHWLYIYTMREGKKINSKGLIATAYDHLADVYASLAAVVGIGAAILGKHYDIPYTEYGDPLAGIVVAILVMKLAVNMGKESFDTLMEKNLPQEKLDEYSLLISTVDGVERIDRLRAREHGHYILVDVRVGILGSLSVQEGHDISRQIKHKIMETDENVHEVLVHVNPWYEDEKKN
ncbi:cation diffusion facilitator family transporter [Tumebacillus lipolyticus]|uniref:Cation diffusion facilitator family transporter n=1 Tax=Tumebacillus lipolyticus TaxID=1280370 RepID=A0ABW4ZUU6_9BACL